MGATRQLFITTDTALDSGTASFTDPSRVSDGAFAVLNSEDASGGSEDLTGTDAPDKLTLVRGGDNPQIEHIEKSKINQVLTQAFRAEVRQQSAVGYAGAGGSNELSTDAGDATIKVTRLEQGYEPFPRISASISIKSSDNPYDVAAKFAEQFRKAKVSNVFGSHTRDFVKADVLSDEASTQLQDDVTNADVTLQVTEGSTVVIATVSSGEDIDGLTAGDQIRIGHATDEQSPVYVAESVETNGGAQTELEIVLDRPYIGESESGVAAGLVTAGAPAADDVVGVLITAEPSEDGEPAISFKTSLGGVVADDVITSISAPQTGSGLNAQVKNLEEFSWATRSFTQTNYFPQTPESNVADGTDYDLLTILYENDNDNAVVKQNEFREIHVAYPQGNITLATLAAFFNS